MSMMIIEFVYAISLSLSFLAVPDLFNHFASVPSFHIVLLYLNPEA